MHFVVLSYPRTGSTVIQRLINTDPSAICVGEKPMAINYLFDFYKSVEDSKFDIPSLFPEIPLGDDRNPVFNIDKVDLKLLRHMLKEVFEDVVLAPGNKTKIGWKENFISPYADGDISNQQINFIRTLFPDVKFLLNVRDPEKTSQSPIWRVREEAFEEISERRKWIMDSHLSGLFGSGATLLDYDKWSRNPDVIIGQLWDFGFKVDYQKCKDILSERLTHLS
jgi:hypothetical protein